MNTINKTSWPYSTRNVSSAWRGLEDFLLPIIERFNRSCREDILDANLFFSLEHVYEVTKPWKEDYNQERPHEAFELLCTK